MSSFITSLGDPDQPNHAQLNSLSPKISKLRENRLSNLINKLEFADKNSTYFKCVINKKLCYCRNKIPLMKDENEFFKHKINGGLDFEFFYSKPLTEGIVFFNNVYENDDKDKLMSFASEKEAQSYLKIPLFW